MKSGVGTVFSSDSSDDDRSHKSKSGASESEGRKKRTVRLRVDLQGDHKGDAPPSVDADAPNGYRTIGKTQAGTLRHNTMIQYENMKGKLIRTKYFKKCDPVSGNILMGFYTHDKRNYSEALENIKSLYVSTGASSGGSNALKDTIELGEEQWKSIRRDTILSYQKNDNEYVYNAKFNAFTKAQDGTSRMSMTSEQGFNYKMNPSNIKKIYRHVSGNDKTLQFILEAMKKLEARVRQLEARK